MLLNDICSGRFCLEKSLQVNLNNDYYIPMDFCCEAAPDNFPSSFKHNAEATTVTTGPLVSEAKQGEGHGKYFVLLGGGVY